MKLHLLSMLLLAGSSGLLALSGTAQEGGQTVAENTPFAAVREHVETKVETGRYFGAVALLQLTTAAA